MDLHNYDQSSVLKEILDSHGMAMQKKFGQNFLINPSARTKLAESLELSENMKVWEVGPGLGALSMEILLRKAKLTAFEIDRGFITILNEMIPNEYKDSFRIVNGDVLKTWKSEYETNGLPQRFFSNLPYNIAATIIADMINAQVRFDIAVVTVQKEVAQRMAAKHNTEDYSSFSVLCQWAYDIKTVIDLSKGCFWPQPNVDSRAVKMIKKENFPNCKNPQLFVKMVRALFACRRKTIKNNLSAFVNDTDKVNTIIEKANLNPSVRAEALSVETLLMLSDVCNEYL